MVSGSTVSQETGRLSPFGYTPSAPGAVFPLLVSASALSLLVLTHDSDSADILKNVYFGFAFRLNKFSVDIDDFLIPGDHSHGLCNSCNRVFVHYYFYRLLSGHGLEI